MPYLYGQNTGSRVLNTLIHLTIETVETDLGPRF